MIKKYISVGLFLVTLLMSAFVFADTNSPVGFWKTIDDVTGKPKSILKISEAPDHTLSGQIIKIFPRPGKDQNEVCEACKGDLHNKRIVGMVILTGMTLDGDKWSGGRIMDPLNGKFYRCIIRVMNGGKELSVRGYIGLPIIGRSQTWYRVASAK